MMNQRGVALYQGTLDCILQVSHLTIVSVQKEHSTDFTNEDLFTRHGQYCSARCIMSWREPLKSERITPEKMCARQGGD